MDIDRDFLWVHFALGQIYLQQLNFREAIAELEHVSERYPTPYADAVLGYAYGVAGREADAKAVLDKMLRTAQNQYVSAYDLAAVFAGLRDAEGVFRQLDAAYAEREPWLVRLDVDPHFDSVRHDPRFETLRGKIGLTPSRL